MQFLEFISLSPKTLTIICDICNFFPFSKNVDYHMQLMKILSLIRKRGPSYAISGISFTSPKTGTIICNLLDFFLFSRNMDYYMHFLEFLSILQKSGLSYE